MPFHSLTEDQKVELWDDGLHFTPQGYDMIGTLVTERLLELLKPLPTQDLSNGGSETH